MIWACSGTIAEPDKDYWYYDNTFFASHTEMTDVIQAAIWAFLPLAVLTFVVAYYSYRKGLISIHDDKDEWDMADDDYDVDLDDDDEKPSNNYLHSKWVSFGGGFYGLMALLTFAWIEFWEVFAFLMGLEGWDSIVALLNVDTLVDFIINSVMNMVDAFTWFMYWPDRIDMGNGWVWLGMAYGGYNIGRWLAQIVLDKWGTE